MRCYQCGGTYENKHGNLELTDDFFGPFIVEAVDYSECGKCRDRLFSPETVTLIEDARKLFLRKTLQSMPLGSFAVAAEVAQILGISRQALHKHRRIRRGFIFWTQFNGKRVYLRKSVELFKKTGDGRFLLVKSEGEKEYTSESKTDSIDVSYAPIFIINCKVPWLSSQTQNTRSKTYGYR